MAKRLVDRIPGFRSNPPPPEVQTVNMVYATHTHALRDTYAIERIPPKISHTCPEGSAAQIINPIVDGFHLTKVLRDGGSSLNLLYQDTVNKTGIDPSRIKPTTTILKGAVPVVEVIQINEKTGHSFRTWDFTTAITAEA